MLTQDLATNLFTDAHFPSFKNPFFLLQCNSKPDWDPQQVAQTGLVYQCLGSALNTGIFQLWKQASVQKAPVSYLLMPHRTDFNVTPDKLSAPFISNNNSRKVLPFCWHGTELVRMLQKPLVRNSLHLPYWHSCINWVQAAKSLCRKFCPPSPLSLHSHLFF